MQLTYCKLWNEAHKELIHVWSEAKAKDTHNKGKLYCVLLGNPQKPLCFIDVRLEVNFARVSYLDKEKSRE